MEVDYLGRRLTKEEHISDVHKLTDEHDLILKTNMDRLDKVILSTKINVYCPVCEKTRNTKVGDFKKEPTCRYCAKVEMNKRREDRRKLAYKDFPQIKEGEINQRIDFKSSKTGDLKTGKFISNSRASTQEVEISRILEKLKVDYEIEVPLFIHRKNRRPLRADFLVYKDGIKYYIEYDGELHFHNYKGNRALSRRKMLDETKDSVIYRDKNARLLRIPYWEKDNLEYIIRDYLGLL